MALWGPRPKYFVGPHYTYTMSYGERRSAAYIWVWGGAPVRVQGAELPVRGSGAKPPEAESSVAFEAPAVEPNLTLMTESFLQLIQRNIMPLSVPARMH